MVEVGLPGETLEHAQTQIDFERYIIPEDVLSTVASPVDHVQIQIGVDPDVSPLRSP